MSELTLTAETERDCGTGHAKRLRATGKIPAVVYGLGQDAVNLTVDVKALRRALTTDAGLNAIITLEFSGRSEISIVRELQQHPVSRQLLHVDFLRVDPDATITVEVPITLTGEAKNVEAGGYVDHILHTLTVDAKPTAIPDELLLDISELEIGDSLTVADLDLPEGASTEIDEGEPVVIGHASRVTLEEEETEEGEGEEGEEAGEAEEGAEEGESSEDSSSEDGD